MGRTDIVLSILEGAVERVCIQTALFVRTEDQTVMRLIRVDLNGYIIGGVVAIPHRLGYVNRGNYRRGAL